MVLPLASLLLSLTASAVPELSSTAPSPPTYSEATLSPLLSTGFGMGLIGYDLVGEVGVQSVGLVTLDQRRWLLQWDAQVAFRSAILANTYPLTSFFGGASHGFIEPGLRFTPAAAWSPYLGARLGGNFSVMANPGTPLVRVNTLNANDGFGGISADVGGRLSLGASLLEGGTSLLAVAFVQVQRFAAGAVTPGLGLTEVGLSSRLDLPRRWTVYLDGAVGLAPTLTNQPLQLTEQRVRLQASSGLRRTFRNGVWLSLSASYARDRVHTVYTGTNSVFDSTYPGVTTTAISLGVPLWRLR